MGSIFFLESTRVVVAGAVTVVGAEGAVATAPALILPITCPISTFESSVASIDSRTPSAVALTSTVTFYVSTSSYNS